MSRRSQRIKKACVRQGRRSPTLREIKVEITCCKHRDVEAVGFRVPQEFVQLRISEIVVSLALAMQIVIGQ